LDQADMNRSVNKFFQLNKVGDLYLTIK